MTRTSRPSPAAAIFSVCIEIVQISPAAITDAAMPSAIARPWSPHSVRSPSPTGMQTTNPINASGTSVQRFSATNTSGNVTAKQTHASIQSAR